ncbi:hypothetical protein Pmani_027030 [Petrolisthes manimaculis]|uniref:Uncharacterized protein n=1 Tax=Petrolisthes manimaculis TaxID=1843537 RepID=A0AAE1P424_9EUCA|nr:hypothetical protein Pmani_027030 [Petrolisthes manimaculis]
MSVVSALVPLESPLVFLDLQDGEESLGRVYITLQINLRRAQQFLSLCLGDLGPSYQGSCFTPSLGVGAWGRG